MKKLSAVPFFWLFIAYTVFAQEKLPFFIENEQKVVFQQDTFLVANIDQETLDLIRSKINNEADVKNNEGVDFFEQQNYDKATEAFEKALEVRPSFTQALLNLAATKVAQKDIDGAVSAYSKVLENNATAEAYYYRGSLYAQKSDHSKAITDFDQSLSLNADQPQVYFERGLAKKLTNDFAGAEADFSKALSVEDAYAHRADTRLEQKNYEGAADDYDKAIDARANEASLFVNRGRAKFALENYEEAIQDFDKALNKESNNVAALNNRGAARCKLEDYQNAISDFDKAIQLDLSHGKAWLNRGIAKEMLGDMEGACQDWKKAQENGVSEAQTYISESCN